MAMSFKSVPRTFSTPTSLVRSLMDIIMVLAMPMPGYDHGDEADGSQHALNLRDWYDRLQHVI